MRFTLFVCILSFLPVMVSAQQGGTIEGRVVYQGTAISGAEVLLGKGTDFSNAPRTITDPDGHYAFNGILPGTYSLRASASISGPNRSSQTYVAAETTVSVSSGSILTLSLELVPVDISSDLRIRELVTISADAPQPIDEVSKTVNVIAGQEMRDRADFTLVDTLRTIPGLRVQQLGGFGRTASIKTRGLRNQDTALLIDGIRFRDAASITGDATPFLSDFTLTSVSRIEILRGSGSSLYGTNAVGGVIDFQTPSPPKGWHGQASLTAGGLGLKRIRGNLSRGAAGGKFGFNTGISRTVYSEGIDGQDDAESTNFQARADAAPTDKTHLSARFFVSDAFVRLNSNPDTFGNMPFSNFGIIDARPGINFVADADDPDDFQESKFFNGQFVLSHALTSQLVFQGHYSVLKTSRENQTGPLGVGFQFGSLNRFEGLIKAAHARINWSPNGSNTFTAGYEFEDERFENDSSSDFSVDLSTLASQNSNTLYVQHLLGVLDDRLQIAGGFRAQFFKQKDPRFSAASPLQNVDLNDPPAAYTFDASSSYFLRKSQTKFRAHIGNGYRAPSLFERFSSFFGAFTPDRLFLAGAPDLEPERSLGFDAGVEKYFCGTRAKLTAVYFYTDLEKAIGYGFLPQPDRFGRSNSETFGGYRNTEGFISRGAEFSGTVRPFAATDIFASYTYTNSDQREAQVSGSGVIATLGVPDHQFTLVATQRIRRFWASFDFLGTSSYLAPIFSSSTFNSYVYRFKGNRRADLTAGYTFSFRADKYSLRLFGTVENLFDYAYFENGFQTVGRNGRVGLTFSF